MIREDRFKQLWKVSGFVYPGNGTAAFQRSENFVAESFEDAKARAEEVLPGGFGTRRVEVTVLEHLGRVVV